MDAETEQKIEKTVRGILEKSDMDKMTEFKIRKQASEVLDLDLSKPPYKALVKRVGPVLPRRAKSKGTTTTRSRRR